MKIEAYAGKSNYEVIPEDTLYRLYFNLEFEFSLSLFIASLEHLEIETKKEKSSMSMSIQYNTFSRRTMKKNVEVMGYY